MNKNVLQLVEKVLKWEYVALSNTRLETEFQVSLLTKSSTYHEVVGIGANKSKQKLLENNT